MSKYPVQYRIVHSVLDSEGNVDPIKTFENIGDTMAYINPKGTCYKNEDTGEYEFIPGCDVHYRCHGAIQSIDAKVWLILYSDERLNIESVDPKRLYQQILYDENFCGGKDHYFSSVFHAILDPGSL